MSWVCAEDLIVPEQCLMGNVLIKQHASTHCWHQRIKLERCTALLVKHDAAAWANFAAKTPLDGAQHKQARCDKVLIKC